MDSIEPPPGPWARARGAGPDVPPPQPPIDPAPAPDPGTLVTDFVGRRWRLFKLAFKTGLLTVLTLGMYRFWMKTRLRRWYWSAIRPGGHPLEYVGDPLEKLLGFLIAVVILAFYIGIVNLLLMFASFSLLQGNTAAYVLSFVGVVPFWFYAQYRARRYVLARTRWRGLRFGLEPGAWGYALRALWHWLLTIVTAGLLFPRMTYKLEKYRTDRTYFGDQRMHQGGRWTMLFPALKWIFIALGIALVATAALAISAVRLSSTLFLITNITFLYGLAYYRVETLIRLTETKSLGDTRLTLKASPRRVLLIHLGGYLLAGLAVLIPLALLGLLLWSLQAFDSPFDTTLDSLALPQVPQAVLIVLGSMAYFSIFLIWSALTNVFVTLPLIRHYAEGLGLTGVEALQDIRQRPRDEHTEAEGFAEALDVGASL